MDCAYYCIGSMAVSSFLCFVIVVLPAIRMSGLISRKEEEDELISYRGRLRNATS